MSYTDIRQEYHLKLRILHEVKVRGISAITLKVKNMQSSCNFYSRIPGFRLAYGGPSDNFTTYEAGDDGKTYLNLELVNNGTTSDFGRIIFHTGDVDALYSYLNNDTHISKLIYLETKPSDASWGERFFHMRDPDGYQLSFATKIRKPSLES